MTKHIQNWVHTPFPQTAPSFCAWECLDALGYYLQENIFLVNSTIINWFPKLGSSKPPSSSSLCHLSSKTLLSKCLLSPLSILTALVQTLNFQLQQVSVSSLNSQPLSTLLSDPSNTNPVRLLQLLKIFHTSPSLLGEKSKPSAHMSSFTSHHSPLLFKQ